MRGLSVRNREPGVGAPLLAVRPFDPGLGVRRCVPATVFLRLPVSLAAVDAGTNSCSLELYSAFGDPRVAIGSTQVPLEIDLTTHMAYVLNQSFVWNLGMMQFLAPGQARPSQLIPFNTFSPDRIPLVLCSRDVFQSRHLGRAEQHADGGSRVAPALSSLEFHLWQRECPPHFGGRIARRSDGNSSETRSRKAPTHCCARWWSLATARAVCSPSSPPPPPATGCGGRSATNLWRSFPCPKISAPSCAACCFWSRCPLSAA